MDPEMLSDSGEDSSDYDDGEDLVGLAPMLPPRSHVQQPPPRAPKPKVATKKKARRDDPTMQPTPDVPSAESPSEKPQLPARSTGLKVMTKQRRDHTKQASPTSPRAGHPSRALGNQLHFAVDHKDLLHKMKMLKLTPRVVHGDEESAGPESPPVVPTRQAAAAAQGPRDHRGKKAGGSSQPGRTPTAAPRTHGQPQRKVSIIHTPLPPIPVEKESRPPPRTRLNSEDDQRLLEYAWYSPNISTAEAENRLLDDGQSGAFVVRRGRYGMGNPYTLLLLFEDNLFKLAIRRRPDGMFALGNEAVAEIAFRSVPELISYYTDTQVQLRSSRGMPGGKTALHKLEPS